MRALIGLAAAALVLTHAPPGGAQEAGEDVVEREFDRDCMDDYGRDLCAPEKWGEIVDSFDLEPAEQVQAQGWRGVRVFTIDGYSRDMPVISVLYTRRNSSGYALDPQLDVRGRRKAEEAASVLRRDAWSGLYFAAENVGKLAAQAPVRQSAGDDGLPGTEGDEMIICLHAWVTVTEVLTDDGVVRRIRNACGEDPLFRAGYELSAQALRGFPECNHLDPVNYRNESQQLNRCMVLGGDDRIAAAEVLTILDGQVFDEASTITAFAVPDLRISGGDPEASLATVLGLDDARVVRLYTTSVSAIGFDVVAEGVVHRYAEEDGNDRTADVRHVWRNLEGSWRLVAFSISPWRAM